MPLLVVAEPLRLVQLFTKKLTVNQVLVVANIGDASMARGPVWEGITFAAMDQFKQLWADDMKGVLPVIINIMDNQYGMGGQTCWRNHGLTM